MKKASILHIAGAILLTALPALSQVTNFFNDTFNNGSTLTNTTPALPTTNSANYTVVSSKTWVPTATMAPGIFRFGIATTTSGSTECQAVFTTNPVTLAQNGDYIQLVTTFTSETGILTSTCLLGVGLYNSGGTNPVIGGLNGTATSSTTQNSGTLDWAGYVGQVAFTGANSRIMSRAQQTVTTANNQDLLTSGSGSSSYGNPAAATIGSTVVSPVIFTNGNVYTEVLTIQLVAGGSETITNTLYSGPSTNSPVYSQFGAIATNTTFLANAFDSLGIGWRAGANTTGGTIIDISSIQVNGHVSVINGPPLITSQPTPTVAATNGYAEFNVNAIGVSVGYQWYRNGTALADSGDISGSGTSTLVVSPCQSSDAVSGVNGYYCKVSGAGGFSTNSVTNSLTLFAATNLTWVGNGSGTWDVNTTADFKDPANNAQVFIGGDSVTFNDASANNFSVSVAGHVAPSSMFLSTATAFSFAGSGSIVGPGSVTLTGGGAPSSGAITMNLNNTYSGGTTISNGVYLQIQSFNSLGAGPVTINDPNSTMECLTNGSATLGINGPVNVNSDYNIQIDGSSTFSAVFLNNLVCAAGKTLTFSTLTPGITNRIRIYGTNAVCNGNIVLNGPSVPNQALFYGMTMAPYNPNGTQIYNGVISGNGAIVQRGNGDSIYTGPNTYSGGTFPTAGNIGIGADSSGLTSGPFGTGKLVLAPEVGSASGTGGIYAYGGAHTIANPVIYPSNTNSQTLQIGGTNALTLSGTIGLNGADGSTGPIIRTFQVTNTALTTFSGAISDGGQVCSLTKSGSGVLALTSAESYTGTNTVLAGTLLVNSSLTTLAMNVGTNGTLGGSGTINGTVTLTNGATIRPGNQAIGTLTINGTLNMQSSTNYFLVSKTGNLKSVITATTVNYNGTLFATNIAGASVIGDSYTIYNAGSHSGNFTAVTGTPGSGLAWSFNPTSGVLSVVQGVNTNPAPIVVSVSGNQLTLSWPADHIGWQLQAQTNTLGKGLFTNWVNVPGTTTVGTNVITMVPTNGAVYYRMMLP